MERNHLKRRVYLLCTSRGDKVNTSLSFPCRLINELNPGCIRKINMKNIAIAHLVRGEKRLTFILLPPLSLSYFTTQDNLKQFLTGCETLGLKDSQLFDLTDLQAPGTLRMKSGGYEC